MHTASFIMENMDLLNLPQHVTRIHLVEDNYPLYYFEIQIHGYSDASCTCLQ